MKFKKRHWLLVLTLVLPLTFAGAHTGQRSAGQSPADTAARARIADDFSNAILVAKDHYAGQLDFNKVTKASITGMPRVQTLPTTTTSGRGSSCPAPKPSLSSIPRAASCVLIGG